MVCAPSLRRPLALAFALLLAFGPSGPLRAEGLPDLGDAAQADVSPQMEKKVGEQIFNDIRRDPDYLNDPEITDYLNRIGGRLTAASPDPAFGYTFFALKDPTINAFATFGGYVGVNTGLLTAAQTESELAGVLAHEISHVTQHHLARGIAKDKQTSIASMVALALGILAARSNTQVAGAAMVSAQAGAIQSSLAFSREFEREADRIGFQTMQKAGFDPHGMADFFARLQQATRLYENNAPAYLRTHPLTVERIADMQNRVQNLPYRQVTDSPDFQLVRAKVRSMDGTPKEAVAYFEQLLREHKYVSESAAHLGLARAALRANDTALAERELQVLRRAKLNSAMVDSLAAEIRMAAGDKAGAEAAYRDGLKRFPFARGLIYGLGDTLYATNRFTDAAAFAENQIQTYPQDPSFYFLLAKSQAALGRQLAQHRALAEAYALQGQTAQAVEQLTLAQRAGDGNFYDQSVVEARLKELKARLAEEKRR
ncbi:M48 family metalloprotease [Oryzomicrobium sp.]|uniref:M48 family metalloprotease n=1 Tax=Oryzomicrobium sp. TaxID=1911578 RepID=UPI0025FAF72D|nr:M48 family metalloprotease [Oryzomicrobium sp.]MCE1241723.1 M48 family metalloprotease [Oryzomicrobium sp.]